jgi:hypothetical protein
MRFWSVCMLVTLLAAFVCGNAPALASESTVLRSSLDVRLDEVNGRYEIRFRPLEWTFSGEIGSRVTAVKVSHGTDPVGMFHEISFRWRQGAPFSGSIRVYDAKPVLLFSLTSEEASNSLPVMLPRFTTFPRSLHRFSYKNTTFAPPVFALEATGTPWLLFDDRDGAVVISPADHFLLTRMIGDGDTEIASGLNEGATGLPANFTCRTLMAFDLGINGAWDEWGRTLTDLRDRTRPPNDSDISLRYLGYWTDNGAVYYYNYDPALGYAGTLEALVRRYREGGVPIRYLQLDSWWYPKSFTDPDGKVSKTKNSKLPEGEWNRFGGMIRYEADPAVLPNGLAGFHQSVGLPLITHNRWIDPASPYHERYQISGFAAVDPRFWDDIMSYLAAGGVTCYEQDWLDRIYAHSPELATNPALSDAFTDNMARAAKAKGLSLQFCMPLPRHFLEGSRYSNLTSIRTSDDRFQRERWDAFLYTSRLASALGIWPWADVFMSRETDNLLIALLSAGVVGIGDAIGDTDKDNLLRAARPDGVLVKPEVPLQPADEVYLAEAGGLKPPMIAWTYTLHGARRTVYVFAYNRQDAPAEVGFLPSSFGLSDNVYVYEPRTQTSRRVASGERVTFTLAAGATALYVLAPEGRSGLAFVGDEGKFVSTGRKRISAIEETPNALTATITFASGERAVRIFGYALRAPHVKALAGTVSVIDYDAASGRFEFTVAPAPAVTKEEPGGDPIQQAKVVVTSART